MAANTSVLVFKREFRSYFLSPIAYIVISIFLVVTGWFYFSPFFLNNRADLRDFFNLLPLILSFVIPAITMRLFAEEYRSGTFEVTRTLPIPLRAVLAGKFGASLAFVLLMLLPTLSYAIFVSALGELDWGPAAGGYVGAVLLAATYIAIGLFASAVTKNQIVAYIVGIALCFFFTIIDRMLLFLPGVLTGLFQYVAADYHFQNIGKGVFDSRDLVYFLSLTAIALYATFLVIGRPRIAGRDRRLVLLHLGAHGSFLLFIVLANVASGALFARVDLTQDRIHSLSTVSKETISSLREPVTVRAFYSRNLPAPYNNVEQSLRDLLGSYSLQNPRMFNYAFYPMSVSEETFNIRSEEELSENERLAQSYGIFPIQIQQVEQDQVQLITAYMGVVVLQANSAETLGAVATTDQMEYKLTTAIRELTTRSSTLLSMESPIQVSLYLSSSLSQISDDFEALSSEVRSIVGQMNAAYYNRLAYVRRDPTIDADALESARELGIPALSFSRSDDDGETEAYAAMVLQAGEEVVRLNLIRATSAGYQLVDAQSLKLGVEANLNALLGGERAVGYLVGNGTPPYRGFMSERTDPTVVANLTNFYTVVSKEYEIRGYFAENGVPEGLRASLVVAPRVEIDNETGEEHGFTDYDLFQLDQFVMRGGRLILFLERNEIAIMGTQSFYAPRDTGLEEMIAHYGVALKDAYLLDEESFTIRERNPDGTAVEVPAYHAPTISEKNINSDLPFMRGIDNLQLVNVTPLEVSDGKPESVTATPLVSSSEKAWILEGNLNINNPVGATPPPLAQRSREVVAYLLSGRFQSYFADKELPVRSADDGEEGGTALDAEAFASYRDFLPEGNSEIIVVGSPMMLSSNILDEQGAGPNALFLMNLIDYANGRGGIAEMRSRGDRFRTLPTTTPFIRAFTKYFNIAGLPVIVIAAGLLVWFIHRSRRRRVQRLFTAERASA